MRGLDEEEDAASLPPSFTTPTKADSNDGAGHGSSDAEGTESESNPMSRNNSTSQLARGARAVHNINTLKSSDGLPKKIL